MKLRTVTLHGELAEKYGKTHQVSGDRLIILISGIASTYPEFKRSIIEGKFEIFAGDEQLDEVTAHLELGEDQINIDIYPVIEGEKSQAGQIILGVALIVVGFYLPQTWAYAAQVLTGIGTGLVLSGVSSLLADTPQNATGDGQSIFRGGKNITTEGGPIPLVYGRTRTGSVIINFGIENEIVVNPDDLALLEEFDTEEHEQMIKAMHLISSGPIRGLSSSALDSIYLDNTLLSDGFTEVLAEEFTGTATQPKAVGFDGIESTVNVDVPLDDDDPKVRTLNGDKNAARVAIQFPQGLRKEKDGSTYGTTVGFDIDVKLASEPDTAWTRVHERNIRWKKLTGAYERSYRVQAPLNPSSEPWQIQVTRNSSRSNGDGRWEGSGRHYNTARWSRVVEIIEETSSYPNSAYIALRIPSDEVGQAVKAVTFDIDGRLVKVPSNYDPDARTYSGAWDGTFSPTLKWSNNPAWVIYDLLTNVQDGLGERVQQSDVDIYSFYDAGVYADGLVSDGNGGTEPRYSFNGVISSDQAATTVLSNVAASMRANIVAVNGIIKLIHDHPRSTVFNLTTSDVLSEGFNTQSTEASGIHTEVIVKWNDPDRNYEIATTTVRNEDSFAKFGLIPISVELFGCTSESQARRHGIWMLEVEARSNEIITWTSSFDGLLYSIGDVVSITCPWTTNNQPVKFAITTIRDGSEPGTFEIAALKYDDAVYGLADNVGVSGVDYVSASSSILSPVARSIGAVTDVSHRVYTSSVIAALGVTTTDRIELFWEPPVAGRDLITSYDVRYSVGENPYVRSGGEVISSEFTLPLQGNEIYQFRIQPVGIAGNRGPFVQYLVDLRSDIDKDVAELTPHFNAPRNLRILGQAVNDNVFDTPDLTFVWDHPDNYVPPDDASGINQGLNTIIDRALSGYNVFVYGLIGANLSLIHKDFVPVNELRQHTFFYQSNAVAQGGPFRTLFVQVVAVDSNGDPSPDSANESFTNQPLLAPDAADIDVTSGLDQVHVWVRNQTSQNATGYVIVRGDVDNFTPTEASIVYSGPSAYASFPADTNTQYWYRGAVYDSFGQSIAELNFSDAVSSTTLNFPEFDQELNISYLFEDMRAWSDGSNVNISAGRVIRSFEDGAVQFKTFTATQFPVTTGRRYYYYDWDTNTTGVTSAFSTIANPNFNRRLLAIAVNGEVRVGDNGVGTPILDSDQIFAGVINSNHIQAGSVDTVHLVADSVDANIIKSGALVG